MPLVDKNCYLDFSIFSMASCGITLSRWIVGLIAIHTSAKAFISALDDFFLEITSTVQVCQEI